MEIKYKLHFLVAVVGAMLFVACNKDQTTSNVADRPVVYGYIMPGQPISIRVYTQKDITDTSTYGIAIGGLKPTISNGSKTVSLAETTTGTYTYTDATFLAAGKTYTLQFTYNNYVVSASTLMPDKPKNYTASATTINIPTTTTITTPGTAEPVAVTFKWSNPDSLYHVLVFKNDINDPFNLHPRMNSSVNFTLNAKQAAYYDVTYRTFNYLGFYSVILYSVNKEYIDLLTSNANTTSQKLTNPPSNVNNGYGIFTAMQADTIRLTLTQN